jgi:acetylornithine deacetylase/succinyl-diaminopimelate desuccinylase-like protein
VLDGLTDGDLADRLAARTLELVDLPSESRDEARAAAHVLEVLRAGGVPARDAGDTCVVAELPGPPEGPLVVLAGHLDTVPAQGNRPGRREPEAVHGLGAADMKAALAVMVELALALREPSCRVALCFFGREELGIADSALTPLLAREPVLRDADLAVVMEPTANALHAGCLGNVNATWTFHGTAGHSARPWLADNAIHRAGAGIARLAQVEPEPVSFGGLTFTEVASVTRIAAGSPTTSCRTRLVPRELPLRARAAARRTPRHGWPSSARTGPRRSRSSPTRRRARWPAARSSTGSSPPEGSRSRPSRRGRPWRSSRWPAWTP